MSTGEQMQMGSGSVVLKGACTIERIHEIQETLKSALDENATEHLVLDIHNVTEMDISCLQLLCSAHRTALKRNKRLHLEGRDLPSFRQIVQRAGYQRTKGCHGWAREDCLWIRAGS